jgi:hypothetical protein
MNFCFLTRSRGPVDGVDPAKVPRDEKMTKLKAKELSSEWVAASLARLIVAHSSETAAGILVARALIRAKLDSQRVLG